MHFHRYSWEQFGIVEYRRVFVWVNFHMYSWAQMGIVWVWLGFLVGYISMGIVGYSWVYLDIAGHS